MLFGDWVRYATLVFGLSFSVLLITQQSAIFLGILLLSTGPLQNIGQADIWVCSEQTYYVEQIRPMRDRELRRVRAVPGLAWAEPFFYFFTVVELPDGGFKIVNIIGLDRMTLVGRPPRVVEGSVEDLRRPDAVMIDRKGVAQLNNLHVGDNIQLQGKRARVVGIVDAKRGLLSQPLLYTTFENASRFVPLGDGRVSYILARVKPGEDVNAVCRKINELPGIWAFTASQMRLRSIHHILTRTGIGVNFGVTVTLGFIVGLVVSVSTFNQFTTDNLPYYAVIKAMGATTSTLVGMILAQAGFVVVVSYGIGIGLSGLASYLVRSPTSDFVSYCPWQLLVAVMFPLIACVGTGSIISLRRVLRLEPASVFA